MKVLLFVLFAFLSFNLNAYCNWDKDSFINLVARTLYMEAGGESYKGIRLVADVILNRAYGESRHVPNVILKPNQFSCWNGLNRQAKYRISYPANIWRSKENRSKWNYCNVIAYQIYSGSYKRSNFKINCFYAKSCRPKWARKITHKYIHGNHIFGRFP
jgi:spore germination cell wall hydrolase CwlJ-like protein